MARTRLLLFFVAALFLVGCAGKGFFIRDMARLDRAYVPALVLTGSGDTTGQAVMAVKTLKLEWFTFSSRNSRIGGEWGEALGELEGMIMEADRRINASDHRRAHKSLEGVRERLLDLRRGAGIEYFPDYLTEFHGPMEGIAGAVRGKTPATLRKADISGIREDFSRAAEIWRRVEAASLDGKVFGFSREKTAMLKRRVRLESAALSRLRDALLSGDRWGVISAAAGIEPPYVEVFRLFGDFEYVR